MSPSVCLSQYPIIRVTVARAACCSARCRTSASLSLAHGSRARVGTPGPGPDAAQWRLTPAESRSESWSHWQRHGGGTKCSESRAAAPVTVPRPQYHCSVPRPPENLTLPDGPGVSESQQSSMLRTRNLLFAMYTLLAWSTAPAFSDNLDKVCRNVPSVSLLVRSFVFN